MKQKWWRRVKWWPTVLQRDQIMKQTCLQRDKWWPNVLHRDHIYESEVFTKDQMINQLCFKETKNLWNKSGGEGSIDDQLSFKKTKFMKQKWWQRVKSCPNVLQRDEIYEAEVVAKGQIMSKCPSKRPNMWNRSVCEGSNINQLSSKETKNL